MTQRIITIDSVERQPYPAGMGPSGDTAERFEARMGRFSSDLHVGYWDEQ